MTYTIGQLGRLTGTKVPTIRYYEGVGLLDPVGRTEGGQRRYDEPARQRLRFIRHARDLGFGLDAIRELLALADRPTDSCEPADGIVRGQLDEVDRRLAVLGALRAELARMLAECRGSTVGQCRILEVLGDHSLCLASDHHAAGGDEAVGRVT